MAEGYTIFLLFFVSIFIPKVKNNAILKITKRKNIYYILLVSNGLYLFNLTMKKYIFYIHNIKPILSLLFF